MDSLKLPPLPFSPYLYTEWTAPEKRVTNTMYTADQMREYAKKAVEAEREAIQSEFSGCIYSDLEHGVKSLNEKAAHDFQLHYPELNRFWGWLNSRASD